MKKRYRYSRTSMITGGRWAAYAAAGAATTLASAPVAEATIHYSGRIAEKFDGEKDAFFPLSQGASLFFVQFSSRDATYPFAVCSVFGAAGSKAVRAFQHNTAYLANLRSGAPVSQGKFGGANGYLIGIYPFSPPHYSQFRQPGIGYIGFKFNTGAGPQYGWARVKMSGIPRTSFILYDYAWADPGEPISAGEGIPPSETAAAPQGSALGYLALGGVSLRAWRGR